MNAPFPHLRRVVASSDCDVSAEVIADSEFFCVKGGGEREKEGKNRK
jgi:hypothetical protein